MDHSLSFSDCTRCDSEQGVGFLDGAWVCDTCLEQSGAYADPEKPFLSRRFLNRTNNQLMVTIARPSIPTGERRLSLEEEKIRAVMNRGKRPEEKRRVSKKSGRTQKHVAAPHAKKGRPGKKKQPSRSKRFASRRS